MHTSNRQLFQVSAAGIMDVTAEMLAQLRCSTCRAPLSCAPVYLTLRGDASCGRCSPPSEPHVRSTHYEISARFLRFPCRFLELGCTHTLAFSDSPQHRHEVICEYQTFKCPESKIGYCEWTGQRTQLLEHYTLKHRNKILENPCNLPLDISKPSINIYLLLAYKVFFLLHTKVCHNSERILVSIQFLGDPEMVSTFKYNINLLKHEFVISKPGFVISKNTEPLQEDSSLATAISSIFEVMGDPNGVTMNITMKNYINESDISPVNHNYLKGSNWLSDSESTKFEPRLCKNQSRGCKYIDIDKKCEKHERYFCHFNQNCPLCSEIIPNLTTVEQHWEIMHADVMYHSGELWTAQLHEWQVQYCVVECTMLKRIILCRYKLCWALFSFAVLTPLTSEELKMFRCILHINNPATGKLETYKPDIVLDEMHDWSVAITLEKKETNELQVQVDIVTVDLDDESSTEN